ncbi:hypothetical protein [Paractinoplanes rishiriensis]|uniref:ATP/GTP-binding protein n=1 Tax=Paractinoplanes rishiriensis TaxID=1050105 RepID=A0A919JVH4_9ACTN|nr:hypothetical protein [Actinoplanes rishiriensis]GIE93888.1 ATP/GTP-binding protein [Actinoplanes rishiriensis]
MLTQLRRLVLVVVLWIAAALAVAGPATAGDGTGGVSCPIGSTAPGCDINAGTGGDSGSTNPSTGGKGGDGKCRNPQGTEIPCQRDGGWAGDDGCYYKPADVSQSTIDALGGQPAGEGGWYQRVCYNDDGEATSGFGGPVWIAGAPPVVSPEVLARQVRSRLNLPRVEIQTNPPGKQLTHLPTWLSLDASSWESRSATASVPGVSVTATARPVQASWAMGNNTTKVCTGPGTKWTPGTDPKLPSPDCGYTYTHPSAQAPGGKYTVTVTVTWEVTWAGAGQSGTVPGLTTTGSLPVTVQESHALITS